MWDVALLTDSTVTHSTDSRQGVVLLCRVFSSLPTFCPKLGTPIRFADHATQLQGNKADPTGKSLILITSKVLL